MAELRRALERDELILHYQPKVELATGRVAGVEALVRWQHPVHGLRGPGAFLPHAEHTALMRPLTLHVLETALPSSPPGAPTGSTSTSRSTSPSRTCSTCARPARSSELLAATGCRRRR